MLAYLLLNYQAMCKCDCLRLLFRKHDEMQVDQMKYGLQQ
ncbi:hypothetical protein BN2497_10475 [Janthinobacterium sp. CG23_2]|nr:hypothetical protein BN2497_10475 [Janthinobacterium sp. CG23_2]CUU31635.1 hypothetical protein BN3177_10475 [Janthinobacterium sp. CG23_2]